MKDLYVDGSVNPNTGNVGWAFAVVYKDQEIYHQYGQLTNDAAKEVRQISGELASTLYGLRYHFKKYPNETVRVYYDYKGIYCWVCDLFSNEKAWNRNKKITQIYRQYIENLCAKYDSSLIKFVKVKGHSGNKWNDFVDELAKKGCGVAV